MLKRLLAGVAILACCLAADGKRAINKEDLYAFRWIANPQISPDGSRVAYVHVEVTPQHDGYKEALWTVATSDGSTRPLTAGPHDSSPRWSPDGKWIAFVRAGERDGKPQPAQVHLLSTDGGEAIRLTDLPKGASNPVWSPDGRRIAFLSTTLPSDQDHKTGSEPSDVRVITRAVYRQNGSGYDDPDRPAHIWTVDIPHNPAGPQKAKQVTTGEFDEVGTTWSRDGTRIYFVSRRVREPYYQPDASEIYVVDAAGGEITKIAAIGGMMGQLAVSPDGAQLAFVGAISGSPVRSYSQPDLFVTSVQPGSTPRNLTAEYDYDIGGRASGDQAPPRGSGPSGPYWTADGRAIIVGSAEEGRVNLKRVDAKSGKVDAVTTGDHAIEAYSSTPDGSRVAALVSTPTEIGDLFLLQGATKKQLTHVNDELFSKLNLTQPEMIWYKSFDGRRIQAWVQRPPDFQQGRKYPLILNIHGGPHVGYGYTFDQEFQWMAAKGYVVLYPNPRGSTSYGQEFGNVIQYHYPGDDFKDLMAGVDELIARGWVDPEKLGVTGGSGGGVLTNWTIGHTQRFKAAVSQRSIADWAGFWYNADFTLFQPIWFRGAPWEEEADFKARSPITYIKDVNTPLMLVEGDSDLRAPPADGGEQMFRALKYLHKPVVMVRFPGESHELSRSGKPAHRVERLQHIVAWFDKYLQGQAVKGYDVE
jgi:dipeptidyl aminopeptidase/acylaminoacyl peptidase